MCDLPQANNTFERNIVSWDASDDGAAVLWDGPGADTYTYLPPAGVRRNVYQPLGGRAAAAAAAAADGLTPLGDWRAWTDGGYDAGSAFGILDGRRRRALRRDPRRRRLLVVVVARGTTRTSTTHHSNVKIYAQHQTTTPLFVELRGGYSWCRLVIYTPPRDMHTRRQATTRSSSTRSAATSASARARPRSSAASARSRTPSARAAAPSFDRQAPFVRRERGRADAAPLAAARAREQQARTAGETSAFKDRDPSTVLCFWEFMSFDAGTGKQRHGMKHD